MVDGRRHRRERYGRERRWTSVSRRHGEVLRRNGDLLQRFHANVRRGVRIREDVFRRQVQAAQRAVKTFEIRESEERRRSVWMWSAFGLRRDYGVVGTTWIGRLRNF